jgi:hypothetical protein
MLTPLAVRPDRQRLGIGTQFETFVTVDCLACARVHLVNPNTGRVAGGNDLAERPM